MQEPPSDAPPHAENPSAVEWRWTFTCPHSGRSISDTNRQEIEPTHAESWRLVEYLYNDEIISIGDSDIILKFDFSPIYENMDLLFSLMSRFQTERDLNIFSKYNNDDLNINISGKYIKSEKHTHGLVGNAILYQLNEIFILMSLACPGSCNFYMSHLSENPVKTGFRGRPHHEKIDLSGYLFETSLYANEKSKWIKISFIDIKKTQKWLRTVQTKFKMTPDNSVAKCIFSLLHISRSDIGPSSIIWIFYALESLFKSRPGENFSSLANRISSLLSLSEADKSDLRKKLRALYDIRSSIVHGGAEIVHPMDNEVLDDSVRGKSWEYVESCEFGTAIIISSLQTMILNDWIDINFKEEILPINLTIQ